MQAWTTSHEDSEVQFPTPLHSNTTWQRDRGDTDTISHPIVSNRESNTRLSIYTTLLANLGSRTCPLCLQSPGAPRPECAAGGRSSLKFRKYSKSNRIWRWDFAACGYASARRVDVELLAGDSIDVSSSVSWRGRF